MRMMLKILIPVEHGNRAAKDGSMQKAFDNLFEMLQPEQTYFMMEDGMRCALLFYDLKENYHLVNIHEPLLASMGAKIYDVPALTYADLKKGFATLQS